MEDDCQDFFGELDNCPRTSFKAKFAQTARRLELNAGLKRHELSRLCEAAFLAALCNISFSGLGGCDGAIKPEKEPTRRRLEQAFMDACDHFYRSSGWKALATARKKSIQTVFLTVLVNEENLAY